VVVEVGGLRQQGASNAGHRHVSATAARNCALTTK